MRRGDFELSVVNGLEEPNTGRVKMRHGQTYEVACTNHGSQRAEIVLLINGYEVGAWRIQAGQQIILKRSARQGGCFTFFRLGSPEAEAANVVEDEYAGTIHGLFWPEAWPQSKPDPETDLAMDELRANLDKPSLSKTSSSDRVDFLSAAMPSAQTREDFDHGFAVLTGTSDQNFTKVTDEFLADEDGMLGIRLDLTATLLSDSAQDCESDLNAINAEPFSNLTSEYLQQAVDALVAELKAEREGDDYLCPTHFDKMDRLADLKADLRQAKFHERQIADPHPDATCAEYEILPAVVFTCPNCKKDSKVPGCLGYIRIKCPHCACQFVRTT